MWVADILARWGITYPMVGSGVLAASLAFIGALIGNWIIGTDRAKKIVLRRQDNGFLKLLHRAATEGRLVSMTLTCKKVYIGYVTNTPNLSPQEQFVGVLPVVSGYRHKDTQEFKIATIYGPAITTQTSSPPTDFEITIPLSSIEIACLFNPEAYPLFRGPGGRTKTGDDGG